MTIQLITFIDFTLKSEAPISKRTDYLDIVLDLSNNTFEPYSKVNNIIKYVHSKSNHPPMIIKRVPEIINNQISRLSSNKETFTKPKIYTKMP